MGEKGFDIGASARRQTVLSDLSIAAGRVPSQLPVDKSIRGDDSIQFRARELERIGTTVALHTLARARAVVRLLCFTLEWIHDFNYSILYLILYYYF